MSELTPCLEEEFEIAINDGDNTDLAESSTSIVTVQPGAVADVIDISEEVDRTKSFYACFRNDLINARQTSTLREAKLLRIVISQVLQDATDFKNYKIKVKDLAKMLDLDPSSMYRDAKKICEGLHKRYISIERPDGTWEMFNWVSRSYYDKSYIHISLSDDLKPFLLQLERDFTKIQVQEFVKFSSFYGLRIYECLKSEWKRRYMKVTKFKFDVQHLRLLLDGENKLTTFSHFKQRALVPAVDSINNNDSALFDVEMELVTGYKKAVTHVIFHITPRKSMANDTEDTIAALSLL